MKEFDRADAELYDYFALGLEGDVQFYVEEAQKAGSPVLELGCGTGRILIPVAESRIGIVGLDRAPAMLAVARRKIATLSAETQRRIEIVEGDMRSFSLGRRFNLVMIPYRAFLALLAPEDQRSALRCIREHLVDGGRLIFNIFDPNLDMIAAHRGFLGSAPKKLTEFTHPKTGHRYFMWHTTHYDLEQQHVQEYMVYDELDDEGWVVSRRFMPLRLRYVFRYEMQYLLELCGFEIEALYGDFSRGAFRPGVEQIWIARRTWPQTRNHE